MQPRFAPGAASASVRRRRRVRTECCVLLIAIDGDDGRWWLRSVEAARWRLLGGVWTVRAARRRASKTSGSARCAVAVLWLTK